MRLAFLFTDLEDSTGLHARLDDGYERVLAESRELQRHAVAGVGGEEVDSQADEFFAVFERADAAAAAALGIQRSFAAHSWPLAEPVRIRVGIHIGEAEPDEYGYTGIDVHRAALISDAGHGGQIVVSEEAAQELELTTHELGRFELKGLDQAERIFQLVDDELAADFPPLRHVQEHEDPLRAVIADDSALLREGLARLLEEGGIDVAGLAGDADELMLKVRSYHPDIAIVDIRMPPTQTDEGIQAAREIRARHPETGVLVLSQHVAHTYAAELLADSAEGLGYLLKDRVADVDEFMAAVRRVAEGGSALDPLVVSELVGRNRPGDAVARLSPRERDVLELMAEGRSNQAIGGRLFISARAVEKHVTAIFTKLGLPAAAEDHRRVLAVLRYLER
ncbi:MAG TPA: response regulator [Gaiellaceae bacterium]|jgi:DNA-binding NarL/FixJ family response regulator/class 3 adenylate cyclase|nr:response regulator [Gaiellaceae bacterium]